MPTYEVRLYRLNFVAFMLHSALATCTAVIGNFKLAPPIYTTRLAFTFNSSSPGFELVPKYKSTSGFPVTALVFAFFAITAFFHFSNIFVWNKYYFDSLRRCITPTRFIEYFITASLMAAIIAFLTGERSVSVVVSVTGLIATTMCWGAMSELWNRPCTDKDEWERKHFLERAIPHFLGYPPYIFAWTVILYTFYIGGGACSAPLFVQFIIFGQFFQFSLFVLPQLFQLYKPPSRFWKGEQAFILLSFASKAALGINLLVGSLTLENFDSFDGDRVGQNSTCDINDVADES